MILAKKSGLLCACRVIEREEGRARVQVADEKRPKWVDLSSGEYRLFRSTAAAFKWIGVEL